MSIIWSSFLYQLIPDMFIELAIGISNRLVKKVYAEGK